MELFTYFILIMPPVIVLLIQFLIAYFQKKNRQRKIAGIFSIVISSLYLASTLIIIFHTSFGFQPDPFAMFLVFPAAFLMGIVVVIELIVLRISKKEEDQNVKREKRFSYIATFLVLLALGIWFFFFISNSIGNIAGQSSDADKLQKAYLKALNKNLQEKEGDFYMLAQNHATPPDVLAGIYEQNIKSYLPIKWFILTNPNTKDDIACKILKKEPGLRVDIEKSMQDNAKSLQEFPEIRPNMPALAANKLKEIRERYELNYNRSKYLLSLKCPK